MAVRYKDSKTQRWTNANNPNAYIWGVQSNKKFKAVDVSKGLEADIFRDKGNKATYKYRDKGGSFISKKDAEEIEASAVYKKIQAEIISDIEKREDLSSSVGELVAFYDVAKVFKSAYIDVFGFNSLVIRNKKGIVGRYTDKAKAMLAITYQGRRGAKIAEAANKKGGATPTGVFAVSISELEDGEYFINFPY
jgi:hypothetical protein